MVTILIANVVDSQYLMHFKIPLCVDSKFTKKVLQLFVSKPPGTTKLIGHLLSAPLFSLDDVCNEFINAELKPTGFILYKQK
jgi:hypothetical protein